MEKSERRVKKGEEMKEIESQQPNEKSSCEERRKEPAYIKTERRVWKEEERKNGENNIEKEPQEPPLRKKKRTCTS